MPLGDDRPRRDVERNHATILTAAIGVLADRPQATMVDIAHASGIGRSTLYRHFPDREALIAAIYLRIRDEAGDIVTRWLPGEGGDDPVRVIAGLCNALAGIGDRYRFLEHHQSGLSPREPAGTGRIADVFIGYLSTHQATGQIRTDLPADWLLAMLVAVIKAAAREPSERQRLDVVSTTVASLLRLSTA